MVVTLLQTIYWKVYFDEVYDKCIKVWYKIIFMVIGQQKIIKIFTKTFTVILKNKIILLSSIYFKAL